MQADHGTRTTRIHSAGKALRTKSFFGLDHAVLGTIVSLAKARPHAIVLSRFVLCDIWRHMACAGEKITPTHLDLFPLSSLT